MFRVAIVATQISASDGYESQLAAYYTCCSRYSFEIIRVIDGNTLLVLPTFTQAHASYARASVDIASDWSRFVASPHDPRFLFFLSRRTSHPPSSRPDTRNIFSFRSPGSSPNQFVRAQRRIFDHPADHRERPDHPRSRVEKKPIPRRVFFLFSSSFSRPPSPLRCAVSPRATRCRHRIISRAFCFVRKLGDFSTFYPVCLHGQRVIQR